MTNSNEHAMACCTSAIGPVCRHRTTPVADALQAVDRAQARSQAGDDWEEAAGAELAALRQLADAVREHGIGTDLGQLRERRAYVPPF